jgi:hypothetical protein
MRILIVSPLYPPDIAEPAPYVKELARRLGKSDRVTVLAYNHLPELIEGVILVPIEKRAPGLIRILRFALALIELGKQADFLIVQNGVSVELPFLIARHFRKVPVLFRIGDTVALDYTRKSLIKRHIFSRVLNVVEHLLIDSRETEEAIKSYARSTHASTVVTDKLPRRPEILPFMPYPEEAIQAYEAAWEAHRTTIRTIAKKYERTL